ncbi:peptide-methionine (S)-S-oxide reductase MsrA [Demequina lignilytica]|uniref:Peptide methionine sulfoxide reductase MsrA n=1 Tax=Demequina lignilytica TaxID=3051663 RepID=A0AAW7M3H0_9MICO|nr:MULTISPECIES: peptide-methionine (S)-S-oxide reductase MsrA [unclassified Demequina]MDN4477612.1 peptide-methionine (S)-S-oxide reductase MsrA [Demequina sp. SYSU T00039-1]MDN4483657.1 peptide-methionine (S)-S-oxide reductase MsrA [Demequina sp. SYSU T0a273]MDN4488037.1 peptide-methionine (S)-S-oxide reductase MsrA [Demequina sp. SYSU T00039]MDN4490477.1 peptide-methionine (S)-S-oxide reductase MsrA [Demequina sp. SYSU T00068]
MLGLDKMTLVTPDKALPGRDAEMQITDRHVVLGSPLKGPWPEGHEVLYVAMGCFWGAERIFWQIPGVHSTAVGYMGGWTANPTYQETCTSLTGHTETVQVVYDPAQVSLDTLLAAFWENHDPTTPNRQGGDIGTQYRSAIFATTDAQLEAAKASAARYQERLSAGGYGPISTQIDRVADAGDGRFYYAEEYHQGYLDKNPGGYCNHGFCQVSFA